MADLLLERSPSRLAWMASVLGVDPAALKPLLVLLIALHDIGKLPPDFQGKFDITPNAPPITQKPFGARHDAIGYDLLQTMDGWPHFERVFAQYIRGTGPELMLRIRPLWAAVTGHHGEPAMHSVRYTFETAERLALGEILGAFSKLLPPAAEPLAMKDTKPVSWALAGLTNVADWIGSNQSWFPYHAPSLSLEDYWREARKRAAIAIEEAGILPTPAPSSVEARTLLPHITGDLSPLQKEASECKLPDGPMLALIEDVTGSGKTEAALIVAARLMAQQRASGLFFALPTMATANAMYKRLAQSYRRLFADPETPSLVLAHGKRGLHEGFRSSILEKPGAATGAGAEEHGADELTPADLTATAACAAWISDDRRKAFLADVGVGTIDQALLGVLPSRFHVLRLWGLAERVLICDEAHSFDNYLSRELETLLEFQAALGGSAVVLSATLSSEARRRIVAAFQHGLGVERQPDACTAYPLLTLVGREEDTAIKVESRPEIARDLSIRRIGTTDEAVRYITEMSRRGATVAWIRNAVDDCIEARDMLRAAGVDTILLHARFAMGDRLAIESEVLRRLGKDSSPETRRNADGSGVVIVGSQILEASLDYDVDVMVTDLAPVDMVIQRAGRLWRHPWRNEDRPIGLDERMLVLLSPDPDAVDNQDWYRTLSVRAAAVYPDHGYVWRSAKALTDGAQGQLRTPGGLRSLLAQVYDKGIAPAVPAELDNASLTADGERKAARSIAANNSLNFSQGYGGNNQLFEADTITPTRLGEPVTVFRLAKREDGRIVPWHPVEEGDDACARAWALSECAVRTKSASDVPAPSGGSAADEIAAVKKAWPRWEREQPLLLLEPGENGQWHGRIVAGDKAEKDVIYDSVMGWRIPPA